ncbi:MAG: hypothetical protein HQK51_12205 [Oligoflexia bacterium]|nr:hypothetical protein [Oligoflexia bacterium]
MREVVISVRFTKEEKERLDFLASMAKRSTAEYVRNTALDCCATDASLAEIKNQLDCILKKSEIHDKKLDNVGAAILKKEQQKPAAVPLSPEKKIEKIEQREQIFTFNHKLFMSKIATLLSKTGKEFVKCMSDFQFLKSNAKIALCIVVAMQIFINIIFFIKAENLYADAKITYLKLTAAYLLSKIPFLNFFDFFPEDYVKSQIYLFTHYNLYVSYVFGRSLVVWSLLPLIYFFLYHLSQIKKEMRRM